MYFHSIAYIILQVMSNLHTHVNASFGDVMHFGLRGGKVEGMGKVWSKKKSYDHIEIV